MPAPTPVARPTLSTIEPLEFARAVCEYRLAQAQRILEELGEGAHLRGVPSKLHQTKLWRRAFTWCEYARTGHAEHPELLDDFEPYDEVSELVRQAAIGRKKIASRQHVSTLELAAIADLSRIHIANFVRKSELEPAREVSHGESFEFRAAVASKFLQGRNIAGF